MNELEYSSKIQAIINRNLPDDAPDMPEMAPVLAMFLKDFRPCDVVSRESMQFSSIDIVRILEESCALSVTDVAKVMIYLGYHLKVDETFDCEWLLSVKDSETGQDRTGQDRTGQDFVTHNDNCFYISIYF